jgi:hypothetical protein
MIKTISIHGHEFKADFDYQPAEDQTRHYPGCPEDIELNEVWDSDGDTLKDWAYEFIQEDIHIQCLEAVQVDMESDKLAKEEAQEEAWEIRMHTKIMDHFHAPPKKSHKDITEEGKRAENWNRRSNEPTL